jgi:hypothetical protein
MGVFKIEDLARWQGRKAGWRNGMWAEAFFCLDFFGSFCVKTKMNE